MVSRALSATLTRSLRSALRRPVRFRKCDIPQAPLRSLATQTPFTEITTLSNGLTVATEAHSHSQTATVGVWIDAGTRAETDATSGTAGFLETLTFQGTARRPPAEFILEVENLGAYLGSRSSREETVYHVNCFRKDVPQAVDIISDLLQNFKLESAAVENVRTLLVNQLEDVSRAYSEDHEALVMEHLHAVAYQGHALGRVVSGPNENVRSISSDDLASYFKTNHTADRVVLVGAGGVDHGELVKAAEKSFGTLPVSANPVPLGCRAYPKPNFAGSEVRVPKGDISAAHIAVAVEGVSRSSPDYYPMLVMENILGNWDSLGYSSSSLSSSLSSFIAKHNLADEHKTFSLSYSDTGLWGVYLQSENHQHLDDLLRYTLREWTRMGTAPATDEVERAKIQLKTSLFINLDSTMAIAEDIGQQLVRRGQRATLKEIEDAIDAVTPDEIKRVAQKYLLGKDIALAALGSIEGLPDYDRIRADMASML